MKKILLVVVFLLIAVPVWAATYTINASTVHQSIDGFGAASNSPEYSAECCTTTDADLLFSTSSGVGLSLYRVAINSDGTINGLSGALLAQARGAKIWFSQWSPPAAYKSNNSTTNGGYLCHGVNNPVSGCTTDHYQDYANLQTNTLLTAQSNGLTPYAISIQNEPDYSAAWDSCLWTAQNFHDYISYLRNTLNANGLSSVKIITPESASWDFSLDSTTMGDATTQAMVDILAGHDYTYANPPSPPTLYSKQLWETEVSAFEGWSTYSNTISDALDLVNDVHRFMTSASANAWHFWLTKSSDYSYNCQLMDGSGNLLKRGYALGNYSRFIRPGWMRIGATGTGSISVSAYKDPATGNFAIVAINPDPGVTSTTFNLSGLSASSVTPWITSASLSLAAQSSVNISGSSFTYSLPASSITTFQGQGVLLSPPQNLRIIR